MITNACGVGTVHQAKREEEGVASFHVQPSLFSHGAPIRGKKIFFDHVRRSYGKVM